MATPITNNNQALVGNSRMMRPELQEQARGDSQAATEVAGSGRQEDGVTVSRAAQLLSQQPSERGQGVIQSADQAMDLAKGLRALFEGDGGQALAAQASSVSPSLMELLKAG